LLGKFWGYSNTGDSILVSPSKEGKERYDGCDDEDRSAQTKTATAETEPENLSCTSKNEEGSRRMHTDFSKVQQMRPLRGVVR